jgi:hypothetical protein
MGGFDMFKSVFENGKWSVPQNMGYPLNTPGDEMYPQVLGINDDMHGYFSATRKEGLGSIDIYSFQFIKDQIVQKSTSDSTDNPENYSVPVDSGDPANLFVNVGNDTLNKNKTTVNNDPVANNDPQVNNNQLVENNKTDNPVIETPPILSSENVAFKVQVGACHREIPYAELHQRYPGKKAVSMESHDGWYKYLIGNYKKYNEAKQEKIACGTSDAWVVVYRDGKRIHISEVLNLLSYYPYNKLLILMLS